MNANMKTKKPNRANILRNIRRGTAIPLCAIVGTCAGWVAFAAYDSNVLVGKPCEPLLQPCKVGVYDGQITAAGNKQTCDQGAPGNKQCGPSGTNVACGYQCTYKGTDGKQTSSWQTNMVAPDELSGDACN